jgi:hypothetical protein
MAADSAAIFATAISIHIDVVTYTVIYIIQSITDYIGRLF